MALELQHLRQIVALAQHGTFVRAAAALHISQPALSRSIQGIEKHLCAALFERTGSGAVPTDLGRLYIARAHDLLHLSDELERELLGRRTVKSGHVTAGAGPFIAESVVSRAAAACTQQYPRVTLRIIARHWDGLLRLLRSRELDFFVAEVSTLQQEQDIEIAPMSDVHPFYFVARSTHPLAGKAPVAATDTFGWPFVAPNRIPPRALDPMLTAQRAATDRQLAARPFPSIECGELATVKRIIEHSDAITAFTLTCIAWELKSGRYALLGREPWMFLRYGIVTLKGRPLSDAAERFRDFVMDAETAVSLEEKELLEHWGPDGSAPRRLRPVKAARSRRALKRRAS
jgi:DNA-binding transcriptional LysR family regulator